MAAWLYTGACKAGVEAEPEERAPCERVFLCEDAGGGLCEASCWFLTPETFSAWTGPV